MPMNLSVSKIYYALQRFLVRYILAMTQRTQQKYCSMGFFEIDAVIINNQQWIIVNVYKVKNITSKNSWKKCIVSKRNPNSFGGKFLKLKSRLPDSSQ